MRPIHRFALISGLGATLLTGGCVPHQFNYVLGIVVSVTYIDEDGKRRVFSLLNGEDYPLEFDGMIGGLDGTFSGTFGGWGPFSDTLDVKKGRHVTRKFETEDADVGAILDGIFGAKTGEMASWDRMSGSFKGSQYPGGSEFRVDLTLKGRGTFVGGKLDGLDFRISVTGKERHVPFPMF